MMVDRQPPPSFFAPHAAMIPLKNLFIVLDFKGYGLTVSMSAPGSS